MNIYNIYILSKSGGLIYNYDQVIARSPVEKTFNFPLPLVLGKCNNKTVVVFGEQSGIKVGYILVNINGCHVNGFQLEGGSKDIFEIIQDPENYPLTLQFSPPWNTTNDKIFLASMFYPLYALSAQLSPEQHSSGIEQLDANNFRVHCYQSPTGIKFLIVASPKLSAVDALLKKLYELYADFALKNPFYSLEMPIRCELFNSNVQEVVELAEKAGGTI